MERGGDVLCWEVLPDEPEALEQARALYLATQPERERIPWEWIAGAIERRGAWRPGQWGTRLFLAGPRGKRSKAVGFVYGIHLPNYGGYLTYVGVDEGQRRRGVGRRLIEVLVRGLHVDAACEGTTLPFVLWESRRPGEGAPAEEVRTWKARLRLFERVGAWWVSGIDFLGVDYSRRRAPPLPLELFALPVDEQAEGFGEERLRAIAGGLLAEVYRRPPGHPLYERVMTGARPRLRPVREAGE